MMKYTLSQARKNWGEDMTQEQAELFEGLVDKIMHLEQDLLNTQHREKEARLATIRQQLVAEILAPNAFINNSHTPPPTINERNNQTNNMFVSTPVGGQATGPERENGNKTLLDYDKPHVVVQEQTNHSWGSNTTHRNDWMTQLNQFIATVPEFDGETGNVQAFCHAVQKVANEFTVDNHPWILQAQ
ncbi:hypothetical protein TKK_0017141 [Trichogramma kaykai]